MAAGKSLTGRKERHGLRHLPEYSVWKAMRRRCYAKKQKNYRYYGGRGIKVCAAWLRSFAAFYEDMGPRPTPGHRIERCDNDGDYCPENCVWATQTEQCRNQRKTRRFSFDGLDLTVREWSDRLGIPYFTLKNRLCYMGWSVVKALTTPVGQPRRTTAYATVGGRRERVVDLSNRSGIPYGALRRRLDLGWSVEEATSVPVGDRWSTSRRRKSGQSSERVPGVQ